MGKYVQFIYYKSDCWEREIVACFFLIIFWEAGYESTNTTHNLHKKTNKMKISKTDHIRRQPMRFGVAHVLHTLTHPLKTPLVFHCFAKPKLTDTTLTQIYYYYFFYNNPNLFCVVNI